MIINKIEVGNRIKNIRLSKNLTLKEFGEVFKPAASDSIVSRWERGISAPNKKRLQQISFFAGIDVNELLYGSFETVIQKLLKEANEFADSGSFKDLDFSPYEISNKLREISFYYNEYLTSTLNIKNNTYNNIMQALVEDIKKECLKKNLELTDYKDIFDCIHSVFLNRSANSFYSNSGLIDLTTNNLMNITNDVIPTYLSYANLNNQEISSDLYQDTFKILSKAMDDVENLKKIYPN